MTIEELVALLETVPEAKLKAMALLQQNRPQPGQLFPSGFSREEYVDATKDLVTYSHDCAALAAQLENLSPVPLDAEIPEYGL